MNEPLLFLGSYAPGRILPHFLEICCTDTCSHCSCCWMLTFADSLEGSLVVSCFCSLVGVGFLARKYVISIDIYTHIHIYIHIY